MTNNLLLNNQLNKISEINYEGDDVLKLQRLGAVAVNHLVENFTHSSHEQDFELIALGLITHTYKSNDNYPVNLKITWRGTWSVNGVTTAISGNGITQSITRDISVINAVGRFTK